MYRRSHDLGIRASSATVRRIGESVLGVRFGGFRSSSSKFDLGVGAYRGRDTAQQDIQ